ncbi:amidase signature enzyme [Aureobasidium pullulans]|uniref:Amidase signature enzyme n=1 Tax=Aureobasidium pullulans TaxID=5580 RepID=A0AB74J1L8_AURPU|nr:amidase signature enzyme [Aureobasidium pullulans]
MSSSAVSIVEAPISLLQDLLSTGAVTSTKLCALYLHRISTYDARGLFFNSVPLLNPNLSAEPAASDARRASGKLLSKLVGIPYTLKDGFKYLVQLLLTAAFSSDSSNGAATSTAASFAAFGLGSETVSSGRSPASNNGLICYTPSRGVISRRGLWPLYVTCDVVVPLTRTVEDMLAVLEVITQPDPETIGEFWRDQCTVTLPKASNLEGDFSRLCDAHSLQGKRLAVPKMYTEGISDTSNFRAPFVSVETSSTCHWGNKSLESEIINFNM